MMTMKTRILWTKIWDDSWFDSLSQNGRILFIYLLTNQDIGLSGCYQIPDKKIMYHTHLTKDELMKTKKEIKSKVKFLQDWVYIENAQGYNGFTGSSNEIALKREIGLIPKNIKDALFKDKPYTPPTPCIQSINHNHNHNNTYRENKKFRLIGNTMVEQ